MATMVYILILRYNKVGFLTLNEAETFQSCVMGMTIIGTGGQRRQNVCSMEIDVIYNFIIL